MLHCGFSSKGIALSKHIQHIDGTVYTVTRVGAGRLYDRYRVIASCHCFVAMVYANGDADAIAKARLDYAKHLGLI